MVRLIIAVIIIAAVLFLFSNASKGGQLVGTGTGGAGIPGPGNATSALPPGYRASTPGA